MSDNVNIKIWQGMLAQGVDPNVIIQQANQWIVEIAKNEPITTEMYNEFVIIQAFRDKVWDDAWDEERRAEMQAEYDAREALIEEAKSWDSAFCGDPTDLIHRLVEALENE
jgi:hypothetical protein